MIGCTLVLHPHNLLRFPLSLPKTALFKQFEQIFFESACSFLSHLSVEINVVNHPVSLIEMKQPDARELALVPISNKAEVFAMNNVLPFVFQIRSKLAAISTNTI